MEQMITLREVCMNIGVSRRAIQGYEKAGLLSASGKNERGYLLYDLTSQERIKQIKLYQQYGFSIKEIVEIIDAPDDIKKNALYKQVMKLKSKKEQLERLINKEYELKE